MAGNGRLAPPAIPDAGLLAALQSGAAKMVADWGGLEVPYGRVFRIRREGGTRDFPLGGGSVPGMATPRAVSFRRQPDGKTFIGTCALCPHMKRVDLMKVLQSLEAPRPDQVVEIPEDVRVRALRSIERMFELTKKGANAAKVHSNVGDRAAATAHPAAPQGGEREHQP